jgi:hypothetical protein
MSRSIYAGLAFATALATAFTVFAHPGEHATAEDKPTTIIGELIDTACFSASDGDAKGKDHAECAKKCLGTGIPAGVLPEGKGPESLLFLLTNPAPLAPYASQTIKVEGVVHGHAIDAKKVFVKNGDNWKEVQLSDEHHKMTGDAEQKSDGHEGHHH